MHKKISLIFLFLIMTSAFMVFNSFGQDKLKLDKVLLTSFSKNDNGDGRWVYYSDSSKVQLVDVPEINKVVPQFLFYQVSLTNYLGWHINKSNCLVLFDTTRQKALLAVPMWYSDISKDLLKLFVGQKFLDSSSVLNFINALQTLLLTGCNGTFDNLKYDNNKITFDFVNIRDDKRIVWRNLVVLLDEKTIKGFKSINPITQEAIVVQ